jgi:hypothetical protein
VYGGVVVLACAAGTGEAAWVAAKAESARKQQRIKRRNMTITSTPGDMPVRRPDRGTNWSLDPYVSPGTLPLRCFLNATSSPMGGSLAAWEPPRFPRYRYDRSMSRY